jgi:ribosomal protein S17
MTDIITEADKLACVERELKMRTRVYERLVEEGKMSAGKAAHEITCMAAIVQDYVAASKAERLL